MHTNMKKKIVPLFKQIIKFGLVGGIAFLIDTLIFWILIKINVNHLVAQVISFSISLIFNYLLSTKWVFNAKKQTPKEVALFVLLSIIGLAINEVILFIMIDKIGFNTDIQILIIKVFATFIVMIYNFITRKLIIEKNN